MRVLRLSTVSLLLCIAVFLSPISPLSQISHPVMARPQFQRQQPYYHPSGVFSLMLPPWWEIDSSRKETRLDNGSLIRVSAYFQNRDVGYIDLNVEKSSGSNELYDLNAQATNGRFDYVWSYYDSWREVARYTDRKRLAVDFELVDKGTPLAARMTVGRVDGYDVYIYLKLDEAFRDLFSELEATLWSSLTIHAEAFDTPIEWNAAIDPDLAYILRYPPEWGDSQVLDNERHFELTKVWQSRNYEMSLQVEDNSDLSSESAAILWVGNHYPGAKILRTRSLDRVSEDGYAVSFTLRFSKDGQRASGLVALLNDDKNRLYALEFLAPLENQDLLNEIDLEGANLETPALQSMLTLLPPLRDPEALPALAPLQPVPLSPRDDAFTLDNPASYTPPDGLFTIPVPKQWVVSEILTRTQYRFTGYINDEAVGKVLIEVGDPKTVFNRYFPLNTSELDPSEVLRKYSEQILPLQSPAMKSSPVMKVKVGKLDVYRLFIEPATQEDDKVNALKYILVPLSKDRVMLIEQSAPIGWWIKSNDAMYFMLQNLEIHEEF